MLLAHSWLRLSSVTPRVINNGDVLGPGLGNGLFDYFCARLLASPLWLTSIRTGVIAGKLGRKLSSKQIYLIRHGQTDFNLKGIVQGSGVDSSLNDEGRKQARAFYEFYQKVPFKKIYTSALRRTSESVADFLKEGIPYEKLVGLNEISWGTKEGQRITAEEDAYYHWMLKEWQLGNTNLRIEGGESPAEVAQRQGIAFEHIMSQKNEDCILICMHGRAMRILLCRLLNYPLKSMDQFEHENLCLYQLTYTGSMFQINRYNDRRHLQLMDRMVMPAQAVAP
jgi:probable phosphoglycerate mutase